MTRVDVAKSTQKLSEFLQNPSQQHLEGADHLLLYLNSTKSWALQFGAMDPDEPELFAASDASFADDQHDRKSSQGYIIKLFGGPIVWKANKQATVSTSTTEAELLAISDAARELVSLYRLFGGISLKFDEEPTLYCDNQQTLRLLTAEAVRFRTQLKHIDIHHHWLREQVQQGRLHVNWTPTDQMPADGLTKLLSRQPFQRFRGLAGLVDLNVTIQSKK